MSDTRYYAETKCEHGDTGPHGVGVNARIAGHFDCPGGSRVLLTVREVDYEAAARAQYEFQKRVLEATAERNEKIMILPEWEGLEKADREARVNSLRLTVDAALGGSQVLLVEATE